MTAFCSNCGNQVKAGAKFCQSCGTPTAQMSAAAAPAAPPPPQYAYQSPSTPYAPSAYGQAPIAEPPRKRGGALKVVLISLAVIVVLAVGSVVAGFFFLRRALTDRIQVEETANGQKVSINTPGGKVSLAANEEITEEKLGVPIYPGAKAEKGAGSVTISGTDEKSAGSFSGATFTTTDSFDEVVAFYKDKLSGKVNVVESNNDGKHVCVLTVANDRGWKTITIEDKESDGAKIAIASVTGRPKP